MVRVPLGSAASELSELMSLAAVKPSMAPLSHSWWVPFQEWLRSEVSHRAVLWKGTMVLLCGQQADPSTVEIFTGQTVYFAVEKAAGITITDERLIRRD